MVKTRRGFLEDEGKDVEEARRRSLKKPKNTKASKEDLEETRAIQASLLEFFTTPKRCPKGPKSPKRRSLVVEKEDKWDEDATVYYHCPGCDGIFALNRKKVANACNRYAHEKQAGGCGLNLCLCCGFQSFNPDDVYRHLHSDCITTYCAGPGCLACDIKNCHGIQVPEEFSFLQRCE